MASNNNNNNHLPLSPTSNKPNALTKMNPMMWRQARTVKKAVEMVDELVGNMTKGAPFLEATEASPLPGFQRTELITGKLLGEGSFSTVSEIVSFQLTHTNGLTQEEQRRRTGMQALLQEDRTQRLPPRYALKQIKRDLLRKPYDFGKAIADLVVEAKYLSRLDHPNIIGLRGSSVGGTEAFESGKFDAYFLILDRLTDSLDQRIERWQREGPPDRSRIPRKTNYALQIANALLYLHQRRIIYRDLKPENIGFHGEHVAQLFDFGLVREVPQGFDNEQYSMSGSGSQWYMAVEIFITGKYNLKADVYSWAITFYEMLTETKPFAKMHKLQHVAMVCVQGKRPSLSAHDFPPGVESIIRSAWGQSVSKRPNILEVVRALEKLIPDLGDEAACSWPTVEYDANYHTPEEFGAETDEEEEEASLEGLMWGDDRDIDEQIMEQMKKNKTATAGPKRPQLGDGEDENDYSLSSMVYGDH